MSSSWADHSSTIFCSRSAPRRSGATCWRTSALKSRIAEPRGLLHRPHEGAPALAPFIEHFPPFDRQPVVAAAALAGLLHPASGNQATALEPIEHRIERRRLKRHSTLGPRGNPQGDLVAVAWTTLELRQYEQLRRPLLQRLI